MAILKIPGDRTSINTTGVESSNVSSSLSGNMDLIKSQTAQISKDYINIKNATRILENYSNWNGYIKLYTEIQSNFVVDDIVYITYTSDITGATIFNIENPSVPDEAGNRFYLGYKVLYVNQYKNEVVINRYYDDIKPVGSTLNYQYISKISCRGGYLYQDVSDGVLFNNCNIINPGFATIEGIISGSTGVLVGALVTIAGTNLITTTDSNGHYILNSIEGENIIKVKYDGYITTGFTINISTETNITQNITLVPGTNNINISITSPTGTTTPYNILLNNNFVNFTSTNTGFTKYIDYKWYISGSTTTIGTNSNILQYNNFINNDVVYCEITDRDFGDISNSNSISIITSLGISFAVSDIFAPFICNNPNPSPYYPNDLDFSTATKLYNSDKSFAANGYYGYDHKVRIISDNNGTLVDYSTC